MAEVPADQLGELASLKSLVYPDPPESYPESAREWSPPQWGVFVRDGPTLVSYTGVVIREVALDGREVLVGGIGGVATHPDHRGRGYAPLGMSRALDFMVSRGVVFALLVCHQELVSYYESLGWKPFGGITINTQHGRLEVFDFNEVMVGDVTGAAPALGTIDLLGPAW
ncbi:MAG TPA: GNAT family N-acetyltransferase [Acidimicrobiia bacterium]|nr:GNAT family N-acetyltransferase [Acidimicrobiia bacterium]